jgi:hypothetical protein
MAWFRHQKPVDAASVEVDSRSTSSSPRLATAPARGPQPRLLREGRGGRVHRGTEVRPGNGNDACPLRVTSAPCLASSKPIRTGDHRVTTSAPPSERRRVPPPSKHQLAIMIWLCVFPTLTVINLVLGDWLRPLSPVVRTFVLATIAVPIVIYGLMPHLHRARARALDFASGTK